MPFILIPNRRSQSRYGGSTLPIGLPFEASHSAADPPHSAKVFFPVRAGAEFDGGDAKKSRAEWNSVRPPLVCGIGRITRPPRGEIGTAAVLRVMSD